jgi:hypothetical protein
METVKYACSRFDPNITWIEDACTRLLQVPAIFLNGMIEVIVDAAKDKGLSVITQQFVDSLRDRRADDE